MAALVRDAPVQIQACGVVTNSDNKFGTIGSQTLHGREIANDRKSNNVTQIGVPIIDEIDIVPGPLKLRRFCHDGRMATCSDYNEASQEGFPLKGSIVT